MCDTFRHYVVVIMGTSQKLDRLVEDGQIVVKGNSHRALAATAWLVTSLFPFAPSSAEEKPSVTISTDSNVKAPNLEWAVQQPPQQLDRQDAPDENTQKYNEEQIRKALSADYAKKDAPARKALSDKLIEKAKDPKNDAKLAFSFYREAARAAAEALDLQTSFTIIDKLGESYKIRELALKSESFGIARQNVKTPEQAPPIAETGFQLAEAIFRVDDYFSALKILNEVKQLPKLTRETNQRATDLIADIKQVQTAESADPKDAKSYNILARHAGLRQGKWEQAKDYIQKGNDEDLRALINIELMKPQTPDMQFGTAQKYFEVAKKYRGSERELYAQLGISWCNRALPNANALLKTDIEKRLKEFAAPIPPGTIDLMSLIDVQKDAVAGTWKLEGGRLVSDKTKAARIEIPYKLPEEYDFRVSFTTPAEGEPRAVGQILSKSGKSFGWYLGADNNTIYGFQMIQGRFVTDNPTTVKAPSKCLENGKVYNSVVEVRNSGVKAYVNNRLIVEYKTSYNDVAPHQECKLRNDELLGLLSWDSTVSFSRIEIVEIKGKGKPLR